MKNNSNMLNEYDVTKRMLQTIRESKKETADIIYENEGGDTIKPSTEEMNQEYSKFREVVGPRVEFTAFNIYPEANNVILGGKFQDMDGMEWQFSLEDKDGVYVTCNNMQITDDVVSRIQKLKGYYDNWADEWSNKLATEYKAGGGQRF